MPSRISLWAMTSEHGGAQEAGAEEEQEAVEESPATWENVVVGEEHHKHGH